MRVVDRFLEQCRSQPDALALRILLDDQAQDYTWSDLERGMVRAAAILQTRAPDRLAVGDRVATWLPNGLSWILLDLAAQWLGLVHVALDTRLPSKMANDLVQHSRSNLLVVSREHIDKFNFAHHGCCVIAEEDLEHGPTGTDASTAHPQTASAVVTGNSPAQILYTSGTIGQPKGAVLSHGNLLSNARAKLQAAPQWPSDVRLNILPLAHAYARTCELSTWILSGSVLCIVKDWNSFLAWAPIVRPTLINLVPYLVYALIEKLDDPAAAASPLGDRLRLLQVGGAALRPEVWQRLAELGWPPLQGYGLTETSPVVCSNRAGHQRQDCVGPPVEGVETRIDNEGVLWTRGPHVMLGYWQNAQATDAKMRDGWFCTGDLAEQLSDGALRILGRMDDQLTLSTGYKIATLELTRRLSEDRQLEHVVIIGQDRPYVAALIFPRHDNSMDAETLAATTLQRWLPLTRDLPRSMQIERVAVILQPLTVENGGLNFKGAVRRRFVEQTLCREEVDRLYG